eukprot:GHVS01032727.1.p1 GENE.GHVS01032727.1~~GHVS01032727.1.p1  ORF type:complete len:102 (+),score=9.46 GHVS01032727.1:212-517(+)
MLETGESGLTSLHLAADRGHMDMCKLLIDRGVDVNSIDSFRETPLHAAILAEKSQIVELLLREGASYCLRNVDGHSALDLVDQCTNGEILELLSELRRKQI